MNTLSYIDSTVKMPLMHLPVRSSLFEAENNKILISPGSKITDEQYSSLSNVTDIVAPSLFHAAGILRAKSFFKNAKIWGCPGLPAAKAEIHCDALLDENTWPHQAELPAIFIQGMPKVNEFVFVHTASKTLIVTDLCFNMRNRTRLGEKIILSLFDTYNRFAISKFFISYVKDKELFQKSLGKLFSYDFQNIAVSHGENIVANGKQLLQNALAERGFRPL